jgi:SP family general alpha glucoside:H+ symporter-like MFS transporter
MLALYSVWWGIGGFACAIASECVSLLPDNKWRHIIYSEWVFSGIAIACIFIVPETPRWYASRDDHDGAKRQLRILYGKVEGYDIEQEYAIIRKEIEDGRVLEALQSKSTYLSLFTGTNLRRTLISTIPFSWQLWLGVPVIFGYTSYFFQKVSRSLLVADS